MNHRASRINDCTVAGLQRYSAGRRFAWDAAQPQRNNTKAAARAAHHLAMYVADEGGDIDSGFRGLLSDLHHLADALGLDFGNASDSAQRSYRDELAGNC